MASRDERTVTMAAAGNESAKKFGACLAILYKAFKAVGFYPQGHPHLAENLKNACLSLAGFLTEREIMLVVNRSGFSAIDGGALVDNNPMVQALARELFYRRVQRLVILQDLLPVDLKHFLKLLSMDPQQIIAGGGIEKLLADRFVKTIWVNEIDLAAIQEKRKAVEATETLRMAEHDDLLEGAQSSVPEERDHADLTLEELVWEMNRENRDTPYLELSRALATRCEEYKGRKECEPLLPVLEALSAQSGDAGRSSAQREYARFSFVQISGGAMIDHLVRQVEAKELTHKDRIHAIVRSLGEQAAYPLLGRLAVADNLYARKSLASALVQIGEAAVIPLISTIHDARWYFVRNIVAILGELRAQSCVESLKGCAFHADERVRKETIRSLSKIGGSDAESVIISLLMDKDEGLRQQAVLSLGIMRCKRAVQPLLELLTQRDFLLIGLSLKKEVVQALGRIGDKEATKALVDILEQRHLLFWQKWEELKMASASALGQMRDEKALPVLRSMADSGGALGKVCLEAIESIERVAEGS